MLSLIKKINDYGRMVKFSHSVFALPFAGLSAVLALSISELSPMEINTKLLYIVICMVSARSAAMGFNRYVDKDYDAQNPRTSKREIPSGILSQGSVLFFIILSSLIFILSSYLINFTCFVLSFPTLFIILFYSLSKRFTFLCHFLLGLSIGIAPAGAWIAILDQLDPIAVFWSLGLMLHISGFDILYSIQDMEVDRKLGIHSIPAKFGLNKSLFISKILHILAVGVFVYAGIHTKLGWYYYVFVGITAILYVIEHKLVSPNDLSKIPIAFFHINASISVVLFVGIVIEKWKLILTKTGIL